MIEAEFVPSEQQIYEWIETIFSQGVRRPGYPADRWAEDYAVDAFESIGLENVRKEPVELPYWEPLSASLTVTAGGETLDLAGFPMPHFVAGLVDAPIVAFDEEQPDAVKGAIALMDLPLQQPRHARLADLATWIYDPKDTFAESRHILPFGRGAQQALQPAIEAGAAGVIGMLTDYPGDSWEYYVPYDAIERPVPGLWINSSDGKRVRDLLANGDATARLQVESQRHTITSYNIVGELPGADDEWVIIGSHHDGPWSSAVEDGSGMALVFAQAVYLKRVPAMYRPHRLMFLLNAGHMAGGAGLHSFVDNHADDLKRTVLEVHLEHAASEFTEAEGLPVPTGHPEARWWFTSRSPALEAEVKKAIEGEGLARSLIMPPTVFGPAPTTDGSAFYTAGVPIVNYLTAPWYLFDAQDTLDKIHKPSLVPVTRAAIRIIDSTAGTSASAMRAGVAEA